MACVAIEPFALRVRTSAEGKRNSKSRIRLALLRNVMISPCRLSVFLARNSKTAVVLRRGPSRWSQLILWDRNCDAFTSGQWFHGRVYERRCDLSPSGRYFIYFAAKHGERLRDEDDIGEAWTAISRPPYFTALALWANVGSWYGGGVFRADNRVELDATCTLEPHSRASAKSLKIDAMPRATSPWEQRLLRDGWQLVERGFDPRTHMRVGRREFWEKTNPRSLAKLCRELEDVDFNRYGGPYFETFWLESDGLLLPIERATWADWDGWDRLVFVREGRVFSANVAGAGLAVEELIDLNPMRPEEVEPPPWARHW